MRCVSPVSTSPSISSSSFFVPVAVSLLLRARTRARAESPATQDRDSRAQSVSHFWWRVGEAAWGQRKRDLGLFAMRHSASAAAGSGTAAYVAAVSLVTPDAGAQMLKALREAEAHNGPSVVLAYCPDCNDATAQRAVESGQWPLYRWQPSLLNAAAPAGDAVSTLSAGALQLDSTRLCEAFSSQFDGASTYAWAEPSAAAGIEAAEQVVRKHGDADTLADATAAAQKRAQAERSRLMTSFNRLSDAMGLGARAGDSGAAAPALGPVLVLYGSDGDHCSRVRTRCRVDSMRRGQHGPSLRVAGVCQLRCFCGRREAALARCCLDSGAG